MTESVLIHIASVGAPLTIVGVLIALMGAGRGGTGGSRIVTAGFVLAGICAVAMVGAGVASLLI